MTSIDKWCTYTEAVFTQMVSIVEAAPFQASTDADVALLVAKIKDDAYIAPYGIFNTMTRARDHGK